MKKLKPKCPICKTIGNMAGSNKPKSIIFCITCGWNGTKEQLYKYMKKVK